MSTEDKPGAFIPLHKRGPEVVTFKSGATRSPSRLRYDLIPPAGLRATAKRYGIGAIIHGPINWLKGIPFSAIIYHLQEHLEKFKAGDEADRLVKPRDGSREFTITEGDEENLAAIAWGAFALLHYISQKRADLDDRVYVSEKWKGLP
jgi:hypothetical protein